MQLILFLITLFILIFLNVPIFLALAGCGVVMMLTGSSNFSEYLLSSKLIQGVDNFTLLAIPFFMMAGEIMNKGGISKRIVMWADALLGHIRGGLGYCGVVASMIFAGVSGSAVADTTAVGSIVLPLMEENGYDKANSTALICTSGCIGPIIPPSTQMILYGVTVGCSVVDLFMGGFVPGLLIGIALMVYWSIHARKFNYPTKPKQSFKKIMKATKEAIWALLLPIIVIGTIATGIATPTEASAISLVYALVVGLFIYKEMDIKELPKIIVSAMKGSAQIMVVVGAATIAAYFIAIAHIPAMLANFLLSITHNKWIMILLLNVLLLMVGCVMDSGPAILILAPIFAPLVTSIGMSPVHFGVIMTINLCIGLLTPPVGNVLYVGISLGKQSMGTLVKAMLPYMITMIVVLLLVSYVEPLVMALPTFLKTIQ